MNECTCYTTPTGDAVICDPCAAGMIEAINRLLPGDQYASDLPSVLTGSEYRGMQSAVDVWLDGLQSQSREEARP